eukprot:8036682-Pyramimonas_sp.AAC.1
MTTTVPLVFRTLNPLEPRRAPANLNPHAAIQRGGRGGEKERRGMMRRRRRMGEGGKEKADDE